MCKTWPRRRTANEILISPRTTSNIRTSSEEGVSGAFLALELIQHQPSFTSQDFLVQEMPGVLRLGGSETQTPRSALRNSDDMLGDRASLDVSALPASKY